MKALRRILWRIANLFRSERADADLTREIAAHLLLLEEDFCRRGMAPADARRSARLALGGVDQTKERHRDARTFAWIDDIARDAAYAVRVLRRTPLPTLAAVLSLALGIGLNTATYSVVDWVLLRPLPYPFPDRLVRVSTAGTAPVTGPRALTPGEVDRFGRLDAFTSAAAYTTATRVLSGPGARPSHVLVARVHGDVFSTLGIGPSVGRGFAATEISGGDPVVVLGRTLWEGEFGSDASIVGRVVRIDGVAHTVVGIGPTVGQLPSDADVWRPLTAQERDGDDRELTMIARLRADRTIDQASAQLGAAARAISSGARTAWADDVHRGEVADVRMALAVLLASTLVILLIVSANVAALIGALATERAREIAVRRILGATHRRLLSQLITETFVLVVVGGALGLTTAQWTLHALVAMAPAGIPRVAEIAIDSRILVVGFLATACVGFAVAIVPALRLAGSYDSGVLQPLDMRSTRHVRRGLVLAQVSMAVASSIAAGLLARSLTNLVTVDNGFTAERLVATDLYLRGTGVDARQLFRQLIESARALPGVEDAAVSLQLPTQVTGLRSSVRITGPAVPPAVAVLRPVSAHYFRTIGAPVTAGRPFADSDLQTSPAVAIVNATFVRDVLGGANPVGARLEASLVEVPVSVVGVVADVTPAGQPDRAAMYVPVEQVRSEPAFFWSVRAAIRGPCSGR